MTSHDSDPAGAHDGWTPSGATAHPVPRGGVPIATHRFQLTASAGFRCVHDALDVLVDLGVSHVYLSPVLQAVPGSGHGYDGIDPHHLDLERGGEQAFLDLTARAHELGLSVLVDVVPDHLAADPRNAAWSDLLRHGRASPTASWFDVTWESGNTIVADRLLLPMLGTSLDHAVAAGDVTLVRRGGEPVLHVYQHVLPLSDASIAELFGAVAAVDATDPVGRRFRALADELLDPALPSTPVVGRRRERSASVTARAGSERHRLVCVLAAMVDDHPVLASELDRLLASLSSDAATLGWVLDRQHYELAHREEPTRRLDRRRCFDAADLVGVRQEDPEVFAATHSRLLGLCRSGDVDGLRIDHPDGLVDPAGYLERLRTEIGDRWLVVEKILSRDEDLPSRWPVDGTTGHEVAAAIDRLFVDPAGEAPLTDLVHQVSGGEATSVDAVVDRAKRDVLSQLFEPELRRVTNLAARVLGRTTDSAGTGCDDAEVRAVVTELVVASPVRRTYVRRGREAEPADRRILDETWATAAARLGRTGVVCSPAALRAVFDRNDRTETEEAFVVRFQQLTATLTATGVEDTACYRLPRLLALCEVGADPASWSIDATGFHRAQQRWSNHPAGMVATSTHDSKRSLDARARLVVLSEVPDLWGRTVSAVTARLDELFGPSDRDPVVELGVLQTAIALHPVVADRLVDVSRRIAREAERSTSWLRPSPVFEERLAGVARALATDDGCRRALEPLLERVVPAGRENSVSMVLAATWAAGVPDLYEGSLGWRLSAADPDNRVAVDHTEQRRLAAVAVERGVEHWLAGAATDDAGVTKAHAVRTVLRVRRRQASACASPAAPLDAVGPAAAHAVAWSRGAGPDVVVVVTRLRTALRRSGGLRDTELRLPDGIWRDALMGDDAPRWAGTVRLVDLVGDRPGALLERDQDAA